MDNLYPSYLNLSQKDWQDRIKSLEEIISSCTICPRNCRVNRLKGEKGYCSTLEKPVISSAFPHFGEEPQLVGYNGSGTIFFSFCNLKCVFCQNWEISTLGEGQAITFEELAETMLMLQKRGCHNINLVTPTHQVYAIVIALSIAAQKGLRVPIVYNCGGYESVQTLVLLQGIVDIYMPDFKYGDNNAGKKYSDCKNYFDYASLAIKEMYRQVGDIVIDERGILKKGVLIRHLVLPNFVANSFEILKYVAEKISKNVLLNIMDQYYPAFESKKYGELSRRLTHEEYNNVIKKAKELGFNWLV